MLIRCPVRARSQSTAGSATPKESRKAADARAPSTDAPELDKQDSSATQPQPASQPPSHRLFGMYMNSVVTYQDGNTAWISSEGMLSWVTSSVYEKLGGGAYMGGIKLTRGFAEPNKPKEKDSKTDASSVDEATGMDEKQKRMLKRRSAPPTTHTAPAVENSSTASRESVEEGDNPHMRLHRQLSSLMESHMGVITFLNRFSRRC